MNALVRHRSCRAVFGASLPLVAALAIAVSAPCAQAVNTSATSNGYGMFVDLNALGLNLDVGPLPAGVSGVAPAPYADFDTLLNVNIASSIPLVVTGSATAGSVTASASSNVDGLGGSRTTDASGGILNGGVDVTMLAIIGPGVSLLGLDATLNSTAQITGDFGSLSASGTTTIQNLDLTINAIAVDLSAYENVAIAPNTSVNLALLGIANASLILNEQIIAGDQSSITVNAFHLSLDLANLITGEVILGHSQASQFAVVPEPSAAILSLCGVALARFARRRMA